MKQLWHSLLPFASDNNGACSVLFDSPALVLAHDMGGGVNRSYRFAEQRSQEQKSTFSGLRLNELSYVMGIDSDFLTAYKEVLGRLFQKPSFIVLLGSPISSLIGLDLDRLADMLEEDTGILCFAISTTGNRYYDSGISDTMIALYKHFTLPQKQQKNQRLNRINLLGLNSLDYASDSLRQNIRNMVAQKFDGIQTEWGMDSSPTNLEKAGRAMINIVVSVSGIPLAEQMLRDIDLPYKGLHELKVWDTYMPPITLPSHLSILLVGEQIFSNTLRRVLQHAGVQNIDVASFFEMHESFCKNRDRKLCCEADLIEMLETGSYHLLIGDPLLEVITSDFPQCALMPLAHTPLSGNYFRTKILDDPLLPSWWYKLKLLVSTLH